MARVRKPKLAVWKLASCDGCQLTLLNCEDELLALAARVEIAYFPEASRAVTEGPYDVSLVEGSVTTAHDAERLRGVRDRSAFVVALGACATAGGIQALRNFRDADEMVAAVYPSPHWIDTLKTSTPISEHVKVDLELPGCPVDRGQLLEVLTALLAGRRPQLPSESVCEECKRRGQVCVMVADGTPCMGPVTRAGCGALCPRFRRGCYACFGPKESANTAALTDAWKRLGADAGQLLRAYRSFHAHARPFREEARNHDYPSRP